MISAIIPAAGSGTRMGAGKNKVLLSLAGETVLVSTVSCLAKYEDIKQIIVAVAEAELDCVSNMLTKKKYSCSIMTVVGGETRQDSVANALQVVSTEAEYIAVHDAARPLLSMVALEAVVNDAKKYGAAILAAPVKDTIKRGDERGFVAATPKRAELWAIQTPQVFRADWFHTAYAKAAEEGVIGTDDATLIELIGHKVKITANSDVNFKLTTPEDLVLAKLLLQEKKG